MKSGAGTLILTGANAYSGGTVINAGTLQGNNVSLQVNIQNNANLIFDQTFDGTYAGVLSGTGILTKAGNSLLTLSAVSPFTGSVSIQAGTIGLTEAP